MVQQTFASQVGFEKYGRKSRRELFLDEMNQVVPWSELQALVSSCPTHLVFIIRSLDRSRAQRGTDYTRHFCPSVVILKR